MSYPSIHRPSLSPHDKLEGWHGLYDGGVTERVLVLLLLLLGQVNSGKVGLDFSINTSPYLTGIDCNCEPATMGFFDSWGDGASVVSRKSHKSHKSSSHKHHKRDKSRSRSRSRDRKRHSSSGGLGGLFGEDSNYSKHNASRGSFFNLGNSSTRSFFSMGESLSLSLL